MKYESTELLAPYCRLQAKTALQKLPIKLRRLCHPNVKPSAKIKKHALKQKQSFEDLKPVDTAVAEKQEEAGYHPTVDLGREQAQDPDDPLTCKEVLFISPVDSDIHEVQNLYRRLKKYVPTHTDQDPSEAKL